MAKAVSVAQAKRDFSELMMRVAMQGERFIIERRGKPMAALVSLQEIQNLKFRPEVKSRRGILAAIGAWEDFPHLEQFTVNVYTLRKKSKDRRVRGLR